jgi:hypothetical protein
MGHKCFISFKYEDINFKKYIQEDLDVDMIDKSLNEKIDSEDFDYIMKKIRVDYLSSSTVTIFLIGKKSNEYLGETEQKYIKKELQSSIYHGPNNTKNGILGIVLPSMYSEIYTGSRFCEKCSSNHTFINLNDKTVIKEFSYNYFIPNNKCAWSESDRYCVLVKWDDFIIKPNYYIDKAFDKRTAEISTKTKIRF